MMSLPIDPEPLEANVLEPKPLDAEVIAAEDRPAQPGARTAFFGLLAVAVLIFHLAGSWGEWVLPQPPAGDTSQMTALELRQADLVARGAVFLTLWAEHWRIPRSNWQHQLNDELASLARNRPHPVLLRRMAIVAHWLQRSPQDYEWLQQASKLQSQSDPDLAAAEKRLWRAVYDDQAGPLTVERWERVEPTLERLNLDWYEHLVRIQVYRELNWEKQRQDSRTQLWNDTSRLVVPLVLLAGGLMLAGLGGLAGIVVCLVLLTTGRIRPVGLPRGVPPQSLWETVVLAFAAVGVLQFILIKIVPDLGQPPARDAVEINLLVALASQAVMASGLAWLWIARPRIRLAQIGWRFHRFAGDVLWGILGYIMTLPVLGVALVVFVILQQILPEPPPPSHPVMDIMAGGSKLKVFVTLWVMAAVLAPLIEETLFRGLLQGAIRQRTGTAVAVILSSLLFALVHPQGPLGVPTLFTLGASFALLYELRGSLIPGIVAHALNNTIALTVMYLVFWA